MSPAGRAPRVRFDDKKEIFAKADQEKGRKRPDIAYT
jgi:hypothetical protein